MLAPPDLRALALLTLLALLTACGEPAAEPTSGGRAEATTEIDPALKDRCTRSVMHTVKLLHAGSSGASMSPEEAAIIDGVTAVTIASCVGEGLTPAQERCVLAIKSLTYADGSAECPALAEKMPSWLRLPPTKAEQEAYREALARSLEERGRAEAGGGSEGSEGSEGPES